jgi:hypothetical protein
MVKNRNSLAVDGGYLSRKLWFCFFSSVMILLASLVVPTVALSEVITGLVMICGIFVSGSAVVRWKAGAIEQTKVLANAQDEVSPGGKTDPDDLRG